MRFFYVYRHLDHYKDWNPSKCLSLISSENLLSGSVWATVTSQMSKLKKLKDKKTFGQPRFMSGGGTQQSEDFYTIRPIFGW